MKKNCILIFLALQLTVSCNDNQAPEYLAATDSVADSAKPNKAAVIDSVKALNEKIFEAVRKADADLLISYFSTSEAVNFVDQDGVITRGYDSLHATFKRAYIPVAYQSIPPIELDVHVISDQYALGTEATDYTFTLKDSSKLGGRVAATALFTKEANGWKVLRVHQSLKLRNAATQKGKQ